MGQLGFFDLNRRYEGLTEKNDPLVAIAAMVPFESFRPKLHTALIKGELRRSEAERRNSAGRKPWDEVVIFKALVLQALYNLSDDQAEYQLRDRFSFMRFLGLELEDAVPDAKTLWLYREALAKAGAVKSRQGRADHRCDDRVGAQATQFTRGQRDDQGRRNAGRLEIQAGQEPPEGQGRALDEEA